MGDGSILTAPLFTQLRSDDDAVTAAPAHAKQPYMAAMASAERSAITCRFPNGTSIPSKPPSNALA